MTTTVTTRRFLLGAVTALGVALAGCGGSSSSSSNGLSKTQLAAKVNAACTSYNARARAVPQPRDFLTNPVAAAAYLDKIVALADKTFASIEALQPASGVKTEFTAYIAAETHNLGYLKAADAKAHAKNPSGLKDIQQGAIYKRTTITPIAMRLGFTACVK